jgi:hypothetical protein
MVKIKNENNELICELTQDMNPAEEAKRQILFIECAKKGHAT